MEIKYNVSGEGRKALVKVLGELLEVKPKYLGLPSFAFMVANFTVDKNGTLFSEETIDNAEIENVLHGLAQHGFECEYHEGFIFEFPREGISDTTLENIKRLVESKATLIKKALDADNVEIKVIEDKLSFPWFKRSPTPEEIIAYANFIEHLLAMAKTLQRVNATTKHIDSEKYSFRCFLLRLGFIGLKHQATRKLLLKNLTGSSAFKSSAEIKEASE